MPPVSRPSPSASAKTGTATDATDAPPTTDGLRQAVSSATYARGASYASRGNVVRAVWDSETGELTGKVRGSGGQTYDQAVRFLSGSTGWRFRTGTCTCPMGFDCKHVVALVLVSAGETPKATGALREIADSARQAGRVAVGTAALAPAVPAARTPPGPPAWAKDFTDLLGPVPDEGLNAPISAPGERGAVGTTPLALELSLNVGETSDGRPGLQVSARIVKPGRSGWVSAVSWDKLGSYYSVYDYVPAHVRLLREFYALHRVQETTSYHSSSYYYGYSSGETKRIDLTRFDSHQFWSLLRLAQETGLRLVHTRGALGDIAPYQDAELVLDVTRLPGDNGEDILVVSPVLRLAGELAPQLAMFSFIGRDGHGVVHVDRAEIAAHEDHRAWHLGLARLAEPVPAPLRRLAVGGRHLQVPARDEQRFVADYLPQLRRLAPVVSGDGSFDVPELAAPTLVLRASYGDGHALDLEWAWAYEMGGETRYAPLRPGEDAPWRDPRAERRVLDDLGDLPPAAESLFQDARAVAEGHQADATRRLAGSHTMRMTTEVLPALRDRDGLRVEVDGTAADYREVGDSLQVSVSADEIEGETDWFDLGVTVTVEGRQVPFRDLFLALDRGDEHLLLADGAYFSLDRPDLQALRRLLEEARALQDKPSADGLRISRFQASLWDEFAGLGVVERQSEAWRRQVGGLLSPAPGAETPVPASLNATLRPYQLDGFRWLAFLWDNQLGGILADDMGLGKTLQTLALACRAKERAAADPAAPSAHAPFLVVAPTSVVANWASEARRFTPGLKVVTIVDTVKRRGAVLRDAVAGADIVVTSYTLFRLEFEEYEELEWSALVLDEAQTVKNHQSKAYQCARLLPAPVKLAITGTPMENNLMELWSLLSIAAPGLFPNPTRFQDTYARPIEKDRDPEVLGRLRRRLRPLMLRRTKEQAAPELPPKQEQVLEVELTPRHRKIYQTHLQRERQKVLGLVDDMNCNRFTILRSLTLLRQLSLHAGLVDDIYADLPSSKVELMLEQLDDVVAGGHRALVFSQFTGFLGKVRDALDAAGIRYCYLDGTTRNRAQVLEEFHSGAAPVFLISLKAGGFGLNLTEADYCFLLDPWWNPATEAQAVDRTHRIGQTRSVMVYRLVSKDTIEEKVMALKARKAELFASVLDDGDTFGSALTAEDVRELFA